jgi:NifU-like protein involved in Fe-S cluster formation
VILDCGLGIAEIQNPNKNPVRIKCALLPLKTLKARMYAYLGAQLEDEDM